MNIPRKLLGKVVEIKWMDPVSEKTIIIKLDKGRKALATWHEYGILYDITDNVVILAHSIGKEDNAVPDEVEYTAIPESLIEQLTVYEAIKGED